ncbi:unnamed protein product [Gordionus sp. m RMFG-2023]|uniref:FMR1-interacting protein NUFIP1-like isoform X2 n=1 Tax=Gordionus sp. m RMFG-2023 TaxID=3053472 RepID=UPI0030E0A2C8
MTTPTIPNTSYVPVSLTTINYNVPPPIPYFYFIPPYPYSYPYLPYYNTMPYIPLPTPVQPYPDFAHLHYLNTPSNLHNSNHVSQELKYHCKSCDRSYRTEFKYKEHVAQHVKCPAEKCEFSACENLIEFHFQWQHVTGLADKCWGKTPEEISQWVNDRKKNYPTLQKKALRNKYIIQKRPQYISINMPNRLDGKSNFKNNYLKQPLKDVSNQSLNINSKNLNQQLVAKKNTFELNYLHRKRSLWFLSRAAHNKLPLGSDITKWRKKYSLLERLLAPEIREERKILLKCIQFVDKYLLSHECK